MVFPQQQERRMGHQPAVVLLGNSLLMDGVAISLANTQMDNVIRADPAVADTRAYLQSLQPDLIILELSDHRIDTALSLLKEHPDIILIGLNEDSSRVSVLKTQECTIYTMQDLQEVLQEVLRWKPRLFKGGGHTEYQKKLDV
jgi:AmiR/NasT family two-component response regulator